MRKLAIVIGIIVVLAVVALAALPFLLDVNKYRPRIQAELEQRTGRSVSFGKMDLKVFPLAFRVENAVIGEDKRFPQNAPFAQASELLVSAELLPLLRGDVQVNSIELNNPKIELVRNQEGIWNFTSLGKPQSAANPATGAPQAQQPTPQQPQKQSQQQKPQSFSLQKMVVRDGQVAVTDFQKRKPRSVYDHIDLQLNDYEPGKPFSMTLAAHLPGEGKQTIRIDGKGGPLRDDNIAASNFKGKLNLDQVSLSGLQRFFNSPALEGMDFTATGNADFESSNGKLSSDGKLTLANAKVKRVDVGYPISADYKVSADLNSDVYNIQKGSLKLGQTPISISGVFNAAPTPAQVDFKVTAGNASIAEMARLAAAFGVAFNPGMQINGKVDADLTARGAADHPKLNGTVATRELVITGKDLPQEVHVTNINVALTPDSIRSNEFMASTGSTAVRVNFTMKGYAAGAPTIDAAISAPSAQLGELLNIAKAYGVSAVDGMSGSGPVALDVKVQGPIKNPAALVYSGNGKLQNASLSVPELTKSIQVRNADLRFTQNSVVLDNAAFTVGSTNANGQVTLKGLAGTGAAETQFSLNVDKIDIAELQQLMRKSSEQTTPQKRAGFDLVPSAHAQAKPATSTKSPTLMDRLVGNGNLQAGTILRDQIEYTNAKTGVKLDHGVIRLEPFTANVFGGTQSGTVVIDTRPVQTTYAISSKLEHVDANKLLSSVTPAKQVLYGTLNAVANTSFLSGPSTEFARTLNGTVNLGLLNGKIAHIDLLNELASIGKFAQTGKQSEPFTNVAKLTGDFNIKNGVARTDNLKAVIDGGTLAGAGSINLADQSLNMQLTAVLSKDYSQTVGGTGIGGYLNTALANSKGELVMPVIVTGTFANPHIAPDVQRLAQMKLQNLLPSSSNPGALTTGILNGVMGNHGTNPGGTQQPNSGLQGILGQLGGRTNQNGQPNQNNQPNQNKQNLPASDNPAGGTAQPSQQGQPNQAGQPNQQGQPNQPQQSNPVNDIFNAVMGSQQKKQQQQPPPEQKPPDQKPPDAPK